MSLEELTLGAICDQGGGVIRTGPFGSQLHESDYSDIGTPVVMPKDIIQGKVSEQSIARVNDEHVDRLSQHKLLPGDIVYGRRGDIGRQALIRARESGWLCGTGCLRITLGTGPVDPKWLHYYLRDQRVVAFIAQQAVGATMPNLNTSILRSIPIRFPSSLETQRRIASILSAYDDLIENNTRRIAILEEMARRIYEEWFVHFRFPGHEQVKMVASELGLIPEGWSIQTIDEVASNIIDYRGKTPAKLGGEWSTEGIPAISALNVKNGRLINLEKSRFVSDDLYLKWMKTPLIAGDILMTSEAPLGELFLLTSSTKYCLSQRVFGIRANQARISATLLYLQLRNESFQNELRSRATGATVSGIRQAELRKVPLTVAPRQIQDTAERVLSPLLMLTAKLNDISDNLRTTRDLLLPKLISGELDVSNLPEFARLTVPEEAIAA